MKINSTAVYHYWDYMDGEALVCSSAGPPEYQKMCNFNQYIIGVAFIVEALSLLYNAWRLEQLTSTVGPENRDLSTTTKATVSKRQEQKRIAHMMYFKRLTYVFAVEFLCYGVMHLVGNGTIYSSSTMAGLIGDLFASVATACGLYHSVLQLRGAEAFKTLVQLPTDDTDTKTKRFGVTITDLLDFVQSTAAFPITFGMWCLLASNVAKRSALYSTGTILVGCAGVRSLFENILTRVHTLVRLNELQQNAGGDFAAKCRRRRTLKKKARTLISHMLGILLTNVFIPFSIVIFSSVNSSTQMLIHHGATNTIIAVVVSVVCMVTHKQIDRSCSIQTKLKTTNLEIHGSSRSKSQNSKLNVLKDSEYTIANESGMSVIGKSEVAMGRQTSGRPSLGCGGLFSDIESTV